MCLLGQEVAGIYCGIFRFLFQVFHSGIPITLVPLDATNSIPISENFFKVFEKSQDTYEAQYIFKSLKMARDTWFDDQFYTVISSIFLMLDCIRLGENLTEKWII